MRWGNKSCPNWVDVYLHLMLVVEVIKLNRNLNLLMTLDATYCILLRPTDLWVGKNNVKYPKSRTSIRMLQPETLDRIKCHTFPGLGGKALDILVYDSTLQNKIVPWGKGFKIEMPAHTNSFIVIPARLVRVRAGQFDLCTSKSTWRLSKSCVGPTSLASTGGLAAGCWPGPAY